MKKTHGIGMLAVGLAVAMVLASATAWSASKGDAGNKVLAKVGPYTLTLEEFNEQVNSLPPQMKMAVMQNAKLKRMFLDRWVQLTLLGMKAKDMGLDKDPDVQRRMDTLRNSLLAQELYRKKIQYKKDQIPESQLKKFYEEHKSEFTTPEMVRARHILIRVKDSKDDKAWKAARKEIMGIKAKIAKGADFAEMAKKYSQDPGSKDRGGDLGYFGRGKMIKPFEDAAFSLKKGEVSDVVKTPFGYHLIKVEDKKPASVKPFKQVESQVREKLAKEQEQKVLETMIADLKKQYKVEINEKLLEQGGGMASPHGHMGMK